MRRRGVVLRVLVVLGVAAVVLLVAVRSYLCSRSAADRVERRLTQILQASVRLEGVDLGLGGHSSLTGLAVFESGGDNVPPFLRAALVEMDASAWSLAIGDRPRNLTLTDVNLVLRFDASGRLLSRLPDAESKETIPVFRIHSGTVTLKHEGRPDLVVGGVEAELRPDGDAVRLQGEFDDPRWGKGRLTGQYHRDRGALEGNLKTGVVHLTREELEGLPFVPAETWEQVHCEGDTSAEIDLRLGTREPGPGGVHYRVDLRPSRTRVHVVAIGLTADEAVGRVLIEDGIVRLEGVEGRTARGTIATNADLDFRGNTSKLRFGITVARLELQQLPRNWKLPPLVGGRLSGRADLHLTVAGRVLRTAGQGEGEVSGVSILGFEAPVPIRVRMVADGNGFRFKAP